MSLKEFLNSGGVIDESSPSGRMPYADLITAEAELSRAMFGEPPAGHQWEFFEYKKNVWIWYDGWLDKKGAVLGVMIRYEVKPDGVYKKVPNSDYVRIEGAELDNFRNAVHIYLDLIKTKLYC